MSAHDHRNHEGGNGHTSPGYTSPQAAREQAPERYIAAARRRPTPHRPGPRT
jgi:hypothetical protein